MSPKIVTQTRLKNILQELRKKRQRIVFTNGCFDILHLGHVRYLQKAKELGDKLIVAVNSDSSVREIKGRYRPIMPQGDRLEILAGLECIDYVILFNETTPARIIKYIRPDILVKGSDYRINEIVGRDAVKIVKTISLVKNRSTSSIINKGYRIIDANMNRAREGLRVIEDIARFCLNDGSLTKALKKARHEITDTVKDIDLLLSSRESSSDVGSKFNILLEGGKKDIQGLIISNFRRVEESLRVLEDISKVFLPQKTNIFKKLRFRIYTLEKKVYEAIRNT